MAKERKQATLIKDTELHPSSKGCLAYYSPPPPNNSIYMHYKVMSTKAEYLQPPPTDEH